MLIKTPKSRSMEIYSTKQQRLWKIYDGGKGELKYSLITNEYIKSNAKTCAQKNYILNTNNMKLKIR